MIKQLFFMPLAAVFQGGALPEAPQEPVDRKVRIEIVTTENGETKRITKEFDAGSEAEIQQTLKDLGVMDHFNVSGDGENVTIDIRRSMDGEEDEDISLSIAPLDPMDPVAPMAPMPPMQPMAPFMGNDGVAYLGVSTQSLNDELLAKNKVPGKKGVWVNEVIEDTPADKAGLEEGDVITEVDGKAVLGPAGLTEIIRDHEPGDKVKLTYYRNGKKMDGTAELAERETRSYSYSYGPEHGSEEYDWESYLGDGEWSGSSHAFLGVTPKEDSEDVNGAAIESVEEGSAAEIMGIQSGDVITKINDKEISDFTCLSNTIKAMEPGDEVSVTVQRDGTTTTLTGELGEHKQDMTFILEAPDGTPGAAHIRRFRMDGMGQQDFAELQRDMAELQRDMAELQRSLGKDIRTKETRITIEAMPLSPAEKDLLKSKGVTALDVELKLGDMGVFPNPSNGFFRLQFDVAEKGDLFVNVHDATGERVYEERITGFKGRYERTLDLTDKATGTYYLVIQQGGKTTAQKLVKQ
ncbi:MAG TPA: PDZ domain-containing protein [Flavobacteriales bacterium]|nr:PDZ domain-containing protein [Flavobacteriales bacterium]